MTGIIYQNNQFIKVPVIKTKAPQMSYRNGKTWDNGIILLNGNRCPVWLDTTWGFYFYFEVKGQWWKVRMFPDSRWNVPSYDIDPFRDPPIELNVEFKK